MKNQKLETHRSSLFNRRQSFGHVLPCHELYDQRQAGLLIARAGVTQALADVNQIRVFLGLQAQPGDSPDLDQVPPDLDQTT